MSQDFGSNDARVKRMNGLLALQVVPVESERENISQLLETPAYRVITKVIASVSGSSTNMLHNGCFTSEPIPGSTERARVYEVTRNLNHFYFFQQFFYEKNPLTITVQLPDRFAAHTVEGLDEVLSLLFFLASSSVTNSDLAFWSFLTLPDTDYEEQYAAMTTKSNSERVGGILQLAKTKLTSRLPQVEFKPSDISNMMIETGMIDRAFITMDKMSQCVERSMYFQQLLEKDRQLESWELALKRMYDVRDALDLESEALGSFGEAMTTRVADAQFWPWTKYKPQASEATGLSHRLAHFLHRTGNVVNELARNGRNVISSEFGLSTSLLCTALLSRRYSAKLAHDYIHVTHPPRPNGRSLVQLQDQLIDIIAKGRGFEEADALDAIDDEVSEIHDFLDRGVCDFEQQFHDVRMAMTERLLRNLSEMTVQQQLAWTSSQMLLSNVASSLDSDPFDDVEALPISDLADHESPARRAAMEVQKQRQEAIEEATLRIASKGTGLFYRPSKEISNSSRQPAAGPRQPTPSAAPISKPGSLAHHVDPTDKPGEELKTVQVFRMPDQQHGSGNDRVSHSANSQPAVTSASDPRVAELHAMIQSQQSKTRFLDTDDGAAEDLEGEFSGARRRQRRGGPSSVGSNDPSPLHDGPRRKWMNEEDAADPFQW